MTVSVAAVTFDCANAAALAGFWSEAIGVPLDKGEMGASEFFASIGMTEPGEAVPAMMFIQVPEGKTVKNRVHLDMKAQDRAAEVDRLVSLGATVIQDNDEYNVRWTTLADPEGNEFCVAEH